MTNDRLGYGESTKRTRVDSVQPTNDLNPKVDNGLARRLMRGAGATALSPVVSAIVQLGSVPLLLHAWGAERYGDWLLLFAIPSYLTFSDLGFGDASASDMSMRVAANDRDGALETFQSSWILVTCFSFVALLVASVFAWFVPWQNWLHLSGVSNTHAAKIILVLGAYVAVSQQNGVVESGYRADGNFATGTFWMLVQRLGETIAATAVAILGGSFLAVACTFLAARCVGTIAYSLLLLRLSPWISFGTRRARKETIRRLAVPAAGFLAFPLGYALSLQGFTILIGAILGPIAVVSFSTLRTLSRLVLQVNAVVKHTLWPELSRAFGEGNILLARTLHRLACRFTFVLSALGTLFLWLTGPYVYRLWLHHDVIFDATCFHMLLLVVVVNSLWDTSAVIPMSFNGHCRIALIYSGAALLSLGLARILLPAWGIFGASVALLAMDAFMAVYVLRTSLKRTEDSPANFVRCLVTVPRLRGGLQLVAER